MERSVARRGSAAYARPRWIGRVARFRVASLDGVSRPQLLKDELGIGYCNTTKYCAEVCPEDIHITDNAITLFKERVVDEYHDPGSLVPAKPTSWLILALQTRW